VNLLEIVTWSDEAGEHHTDLALSDPNNLTEFELRFVGGAYYGLASRFFHRALWGQRVTFLSAFPLCVVVLVRKPNAQSSVFQGEPEMEILAASLNAPGLSIEYQ
jgi:hypothetical protein